MEHSSIRKSTLIGKIVYLLLSLPLGICYFTLVITGISVGMGTLIIWIGLPVLFATLLIVSGMARIERHMVRSLLGFDLPRTSLRGSEQRQGFLSQLGNMLREPFTWTRMFYMILKLPLGIISFTLVVTLVSVSLALTLMPLVYLVNLFVNMILLKAGVVGTSIYVIPYFLEINGDQFDMMMFVRSFIGVPLGMISWILTYLMINGLASLSGELAAALLGPEKVEMSTQPKEEWEHLTLLKDRSTAPYYPPLTQTTLQSNQ